MMRRIRPALRKVLLGLVYSSALLVWVALVADTAGLAQQAAAPPMFPTTTPAPGDIATPRPQPPRVVVSKPAEVLQDIVANADRRVAGFHPKTGRYISAWLPDSFDSVNRKSF